MSGKNGNEGSLFERAPSSMISGGRVNVFTCAEGQGKASHSFILTLRCAEILVRAGKQNKCPERERRNQPNAEFALQGSLNSVGAALQCAMQGTGEWC